MLAGETLAGRVEVRSAVDDRERAVLVRWAAQNSSRTRYAMARDGYLLPYVYHPDILATLADHGLSPGPDTDPARVREALSGLYRHEIRRLRDRLLRKEFARTEYAGRVARLRQRYVLLSIPIERWTTGGGAG